MMTLIICILLATLASQATAFVIGTAHQSAVRKSTPHSTRQPQFMSESNHENINSEERKEDCVQIPELSWRVAKLRLEEAHSRQILNRKPLKLSYRTSRRWIQANWAPKTKEEFNDLVANGNLRTPYISKRPEEYYGARGEWISWDHYLLGSDEEDEKNGMVQMSKWE